MLSFPKPCVGLLIGDRNRKKPNPDISISDVVAGHVFSEMRLDPRQAPACRLRSSAREVPVLIHSPFHMHVPFNLWCGSRL